MSFSPSTDPARALLVARGLGVVLDGRRIVDGVDLSVSSGEIAAIVGPNGAGKTTLLRALAGVLRPASGEVLLEGRPLASRSRRELARELAYLPQEIQAAFSLTVEEVVRQGRYAQIGPWGVRRPEDREAVEEAMVQADVAHLARRPLPTLSGGERRRVFLARAIAQRARVLVLDEPVTALDVGHACELLDLLARLAREGAAIVFSLHELTLATRATTTLTLLDGGRVLARGEAAEVLSSELAERAFGIPLRVVGDPPVVAPLPRRDGR